MGGEGRRVEIASRIDVDAPVQRVWDAVVDWDTQHEWMFMTRVRGTDGGGRGVGAGLEAFTGLGRIGFLDPMVITEWRPPRRCVVRHTGRVVRGTAAFEVVPRAEGKATFVWSEQLDLPFGRFGRVCWPVVKPLVALPLAYSLRRLKRRIERLAVES